MSLTLFSLALRNFVFTVLQPGIVAGVIPFMIAKSGMKNAFTNHFQILHYIAVLVFLAGIIILFHCIARFVVEGLGTLSPADPTKRLVITGLYKYSRNPMYIGIMMILFGEVIFSKSVYLLFYSICIFALFNIFVACKEEPRLKKDFGKDYEIYCKTVRRWV